MINNQIEENSKMQSQAIHKREKSNGPYTYRMLNLPYKEAIRIKGKVVPLLCIYWTCKDDKI